MLSSNLFILICVIYALTVTTSDSDGLCDGVGDGAFCFVSIPMTGNSAEQFCQFFFGTSLATVTTDDERNAIIDACEPAAGCEREISSLFYTCGCIIGLTDQFNERGNNEDDWQWWDGTTANFDATGLWCPSQPNDYFGQDCVEVRVDSDHFTWPTADCYNDFDCDSSKPRPFFCNAPTGSRSSSSSDDDS